MVRALLFSLSSCPWEWFESRDGHGSEQTRKSDPRERRRANPNLCQVELLHFLPLLRPRRDTESCGEGSSGEGSCGEGSRGKGLCGEGLCGMMRDDAAYGGGRASMLLRDERTVRDARTTFGNAASAPVSWPLPAADKFVAPEKSDEGNRRWTDWMPSALHPKTSNNEPGRTASSGDADVGIGRHTWGLVHRKDLQIV